jgi:hypothetical protein
VGTDLFKHIKPILSREVTIVIFDTNPTSTYRCLTLDAEEYIDPFLIT